MASIDPALIARAKALLTSPRTEWPVIAGEATDIPTIYRTYLGWIAAVPAIASFIGLSVIGFGLLGTTVRVPLLGGVANAAVGFALSLAVVYVLALIVDALAPTFGGRRDRLAAFKLVAYASTASMLAGIVYLLPALSFVALLGSAYSVYLLYLGLPVLMRCPPAKALPFAAVVVVCGLLAGLVVGAVSAIFMR